MHLGVYPYQIWHGQLSEQFVAGFNTFNQELQKSTGMPNNMANLITQLLAKHIGPLVDQASLSAKRREILEQMIAMPNELVRLYEGLDRMEQLNAGVEAGGAIGDEHAEAGYVVADMLREILGKMGKVEQCYRENDRLRQENEVLYMRLMQSSVLPVELPRPQEPRTEEEIEVDL